MSSRETARASGPWCWKATSAFFFFFFLMYFFLLCGSSNVQNSTYRDWVAKGWTVLVTRHFSSNFTLCACSGYGAGSFTYFSFASWQNVELCPTALEGHCRRKGFFLLVLVCPQQDPPCSCTVNPFFRGCCLHCTAVSHSQQLPIGPTSVDFRVDTLQQNTSQCTAFPSTLEREDFQHDPLASLHSCFSDIQWARARPSSKVCISVLGNWRKLCVSPRGS